MSNKIAPCKGCIDRFAGCHSMCKSYIEWKALKDKKREETFNTKMTEWDARGLKIEGQTKALKKRRNKR